VSLRLAIRQLVRVVATACVARLLLLVSFRILGRSPSSPADQATPKPISKIRLAVSLIAVYTASFLALIALQSIGQQPLYRRLLTPAFMAAMPVGLVYAFQISPKKTGRSQSLGRVSRFSTLLGLLSLPYLVLFASESRVQESFYDSTAQVIPVLLIALTVQTSNGWPEGLGGMISVAIFSFFGEGLCLTSAASPGMIGSFGFAIVSGSIICQSYALFLAFLWQPLAPHGNQS